MRIDELRPFIGCEGVLSVFSAQLEIHVEILNVENRWGHAWLLVKPVAGSGEQWVHEDRVKL